MSNDSTNEHTILSVIFRIITKLQLRHFDMRSDFTTNRCVVSRLPTVACEVPEYTRNGKKHLYRWTENDYGRQIDSRNVYGSIKHQ